MPRRTVRVLTLLLAALSGSTILSGSARADEGMWLMNKPPVAVLKERYKFEPDAAWLEHLQKSAVNFGGASGSFVSPHGLVMTNHHVGSGQLRKLSSAEHDYYRDGFFARTSTDEIKCPDIELHTLVSIEDVTEKITAAIGDKTGRAAVDARRAAMAQLESAAREKSGLDCNVVTLYHGARYHLYSSRRYTDVRLVFAPEHAIAFWGGDDANFEYPRFNLDLCLFRVYENDKPIACEHYLKWSAAGAAENDLALVAGHPGRTQRLYTYDHLRFLRDVEMPLSMQEVWRRESIWQEFINRGDEFRRLGQPDLFGAQNRRKSAAGILAGLQTPTVMAQIKKNEDRVRTLVAADAKRTADWSGAWDRVSAALDEYRGFQRRHAAMRAFRSDLTRIALTLVRLADELPKPSGERLREYRESALESLYYDLYSPAPIYDELEIRRIESALAYFAEQLGGDDPLVVSLLAGKSPAARAAEVVRGTKLKDVNVRKELAKGGKAALDAASDPLIALLRAFDAEDRKLRKMHEESVDSVTTDAYAKIAAARFAFDGESVYPDATGTLRLAFGPIKGYRTGDAAVPAFTNFAGFYAMAKERHEEGPYALPKRWVERKDKLKLDTPFNFILTADIIGGNSGSPVVNKAGEVIGLIFDGNIDSLIWDIAYTDETGRAVAVDARAIIEALRSVYDATDLANELTGAAGKN